MNDNTQKIIADLRKAGLNMDSIEYQLRVNPLLEKQTDRIVGDGILRQQEYTKYMNETLQRRKDIEEQATKLATLHDAAATTELPKAALETIAALEEKLLETGLFDEDSVKAVSYVGKKPLFDIIDKSKQAPAYVPPTVSNPVKETPMPNFNPDDFVDLDTFRTSNANIALGNVVTSLELQAALEEIKSLGIKVDRPTVKKLQDSLKPGLESGKNFDQILDEVFDVTKVKEAKQKEDFDKRIEEAKKEARAETLKEMGVPAKNRFGHGRHPILDRKSATETNQPALNTNIEAPKEAPKPDEEAQQQVALDKLPRNKLGDVEVFRLRRSREDRMRDAMELNEKVQEALSKDITYVE